MHTGKVSIVIPSNKEIFLSRTIQDILEKATGDIEVIVILDGYWPTETVREKYTTPAIIDDPRVSYIHHGQTQGMRAGINHGVSLAKGEYILKCDAHVMFDKGFDEVLKRDYRENTVFVPRRKRLDPENWCPQDVGKPDVDYEFLSYPYWKEQEVGIHGTIWTQRIIDRTDPKFNIDDNPSFQGSCWFMKKSYFEFLELMDDKNFGSFANEAQEIGFKAWLSGGRVMVNKNTWYAHLHKGKKYGRGYFISKGTFDIARDYTLRWLADKPWHKQKYDFSYMLEVFPDMPTWPKNWQEELRKRGYDVK